MRLATESHRRSGTRRWGNISNICSFSPADWLIDDGRNSWLHKQNQTTVDLGVSKNSGFSPPIIHFHKAFPLLSPSILGYPYCWKPPISKFTQNMNKINDFTMLRKYFGERFRGGRKSLEIGGCFESYFPQVITEQKSDLPLLERNWILDIACINFKTSKHYKKKLHAHSLKLT